jgi:hypothetical protein
MSRMKINMGRGTIISLCFAIIAIVWTYKKIKLLGKGSFGKAFLVECGSDNVIDNVLIISV